MKKFVYFFGSFAALIGAGTSIGWSIYLKQWGMLLGVLVLILAAFPTVKGWVKNLVEQ